MIPRLPPFNFLDPERIRRIILENIKVNEASIQKLIETAKSDVGWEAIIWPLESMDERLQRAMGIASHCHSVIDSKEWRDVYQHCVGAVSDYYSQLGQNRDLLQLYTQFNENSRFGALSSVRRRVVTLAMRDFRLSGIDLPESGRDRFREISRSLSKLQARFAEQVLDATEAWSLELSEPQQTEGLPEHVHRLLADNARQRSVPGLLATLDQPTYLGLMTYARDASLRRDLYQAYATKASDQGPDAGKWDNGPIMEEIMSLRHEEAQLLQFPTFAHLSIECKMASSPEQVLDFLRSLARQVRPIAEKELHELSRYAFERDGKSDLQPWDMTYYSEGLRKEKFDISQEQLRPYFPLPTVLKGMFVICQRMYGIQLKEEHDISTWHPDVVVYAIEDEKGDLLGHFYLDPFARMRKRGGAWMAGQVNRLSIGDGIEPPVAFLVCNFTPAEEGKDALLTHEDVTTLFHEFGHGLHHLLTQIDEMPVAGINGVEWDAVELPSQFMENFCWRVEALPLISGHVETGEPLPVDILNKLVAMRCFQSGIQTVRQLEFALFDFLLHLQYKPGQTSGDILELLKEVREEVAVVFPPAWHRFPHGFTHIFAGGYAAGYYSYKWAEMLSADVFSAFDEEGVFNPATGHRFLHEVLEQGGSRPAMDSFVAFRGREPEIEALLRQDGIVR